MKMMRALLARCGITAMFIKPRTNALLNIFYYFFIFQFYSIQSASGAGAKPGFIIYKR